MLETFIIIIIIISQLCVREQPTERNQSKPTNKKTTTFGQLEGVTGSNDNNGMNNVLYLLTFALIRHARLTGVKITHTNKRVAET